MLPLYLKIKHRRSLKMIEKTSFRTCTRLSFFNICTFIVTLLGSIFMCSATESDVYCLKSIKDSLQDPSNALASWEFSNATEGSICRFNGIECWNPDESMVLNIRLSGFGLIGEFPRGIRNCTSMSGLDLSNNKLYGIIPSDISSMLRYVTTLDLSNNQFSGNIPPAIANCTYLNVLKLENNNLEGEIPNIIASMLRLRTLNVANNYLTGPVPSFLSQTITAENFANNPGLCGKPLNKCENSWIWKHIDRASFIKAFVIGWVVSASLVLVLQLFQFPSKVVNKIVSLLLIVLPKKRKRMRAKKHSTSRSDSPGKEELNSHQKMLKLEKFVTRMSLMELAKATSGFSEDYLVGNGMLGKVYRAILTNEKSTLAIKKFHDWENLEEEFVSEITTLGGLKHKNLLPLIGFCLEMEERLLVYKYMPNGNLHELLYPSEDKAKILDFPLRVKIALGIAKGLAWLHHGCKLNVTHGNISTRCILLDRDFEPKLSNFWEAKIWSNDEPALSWSIFPVAEYSCSGSYKKDIYCFGIVLLELVTGKEPHELTSSRNLFDHSPCLLDADRDMIGKGVDNLILQFLELACNCVKFFPNERPTMLEVYDTLETISQGRMQ